MGEEMKSLVIVESPKKAETISSFLPPERYFVIPSSGHIRDLPRKQWQDASNGSKGGGVVGVRLENRKYIPFYVLSKNKKHIMESIEEGILSADEIILATDNDREVEAIAWHLIQHLKPNLPVRRMVFNEITENAIKKSLKNTRDIDKDLVAAQEVRRVLDRLVGYRISPVIWDKIGHGSAGRVQSVASRLIADVEYERMKFKPSLYWDIEVEMEIIKGVDVGKKFKGVISHLSGRPLVSKDSFDLNTGELKDTGHVLLNASEVDDLLGVGSSLVCEISEMISEEITESPPPPFNTAALHQGAEEKLGWDIGKTMRIAQELYNQGDITYIRSDSEDIPEHDVDAIRGKIEQDYGKEYLRNREKGGDSSEKAHWGIHSSNKDLRTAKEKGLEGDQAVLYDLIWELPRYCPIVHFFSNIS